MVETGNKNMPIRSGSSRGSFCISYVTLAHTVREIYTKTKKVPPPPPPLPPKVFARFKYSDAVNEAPYLYLAHRRAQGGCTSDSAGHGVTIHKQICKGVKGSETNPKPEQFSWQKVFPKRKTFSIMILPQVHLRKPCYDFYFL